MRSIVSSTFNYVKVEIQHVNTYPIAHLQFMPIQAEQYIEGSDYDSTRQNTRHRMIASPNKNQVVTIDIQSAKTLHQFGAKPMPYAHAEL